MPLHLITGRANAGKTGLVNARLLESLEAGEAPVLLLPGVADVARASAEYAEKAPAGLGVSTFTRWGDSLWALHGDGRRIIGDAAREAFVRRAIDQTPLVELSAISSTPGFTVMLARAVADASEHQPRRVAGTPALAEAVIICHDYRQLIAGAGLIEGCEAWSLLAANPPRLGGVVAANRFATLSSIQATLLQGLSRTNDVVVALTWEDGFVPTQALDPLVRRLAEAADRIDEVEEPDSEGEIASLGNHLYSTGGVERTGEVKIGLASGSEAEATLVARAVAEAVSSGTPPDHVAVAFPELAPVVHGVQLALAAEGIDCEPDFSAGVSSMPLGRSLDALLTLAAGGGNRATALSVLLGPHSDVPADACAKIDAEWRKNRITEPKKLLETLAQQHGSCLAAAAAAAQWVSRGHEHAVDGSKWQTLLDALLSAAAGRQATAGTTGVGELASSLAGDAAAAHAIARAVGEMASVDGEDFSAGDVRSSLNTIVAGGSAGDHPGRVLVTELRRLGSRRFDVIVLAGLTSVELPVARQDSLLDELGSILGASPITEPEQEARLAFYLAVSRARKRLVLVRRDADEQGGGVRPSVLFEEAVDAYRVPGEDAEWPAAAPEPSYISAADIVSSAPVFTRCRRAAREEAVQGRCMLGAPERGALREDEALERLAREQLFSATEIEAYLHCPYRWFYERVVRPEEIDVEIDARAVGTLAHSLLKAFYDELPIATGRARVTPEGLETALELLDRVTAEKGSGVKADGLAEELDVARALRWVRSAVEDDAGLLPGFAPTVHELAFGGSGQQEVVLGGVRFAGRIDRIDTSEDAVFVTDYKSSRRVIGHEKFAEEAKIQAVVYGIAASQAAGLPLGGSVYRSLRSRELRGFWRADAVGGLLALGNEDDAVGEKRIAELAAEAAERIERAVAGIRAGRVPREPSVKGACAFCGLRVQCKGAQR